MFRFIKHSRERTIKQEVDSIVLRLTDDHTDAEIGEIVNSIKERSVAYLKYRKEHLTNQLEDCINSINKLK